MAASAHSMRAGSAHSASVTARQPRNLGAGFAAYLDALDTLVDGEQVQLGRRVAEEVRKLVACCDWLPEDCCEPGEDGYRRHLLYADPEGRYTVMAVVWRPGQTTPVHGHTAWGAVGVYRGNPSVEAFRYEEGGTPEMCGQFCCCPGQVSHVDEGVDEPHRIFNASDDIAITIHTYGRDLTEDPASINIIVS